MKAVRKPFLFRAHTAVLDSGQFMSGPPRKRAASKAAKKKRTPYKQGFGARVREAREAAGYKVRATFADAVGVDYRRLQRWEDGDNLPRDADRQIIERIAELVKREVLWLERGISIEQTALPEVEEYLRSNDVQEDVANALRKLPFAELLVPSPTVKELDELRILLEMMIRGRRQRPDGDTGA